MNLPYALRFQLENICIIGTTPIPHTPDPYTISHIIQLIVNMIAPYSTFEGVQTPTYRHPQGVCVEAYIIPIIADLQAIRKFCGFLSHAAKMYCWFCLCIRDDIERLDWRAWDMRNGTTVRQEAAERKALESMTAREILSRSNGVRWVAMHEFGHWNPVSHTLLGFMHNWLEGILQHQLRTLWGIGRSKKAQESLETLYTDGSNARTTDSDVSLSSIEESEHNNEAMDIDNGAEAHIIPPPHPYYDSNSDDDDTIHDFMGGLPENSSHPIFSFTDAQLQHIRNAIRDVILPTSVARLPENLGEESHGKLKAEEYLTLFTLILPLVLPDLWYESNPALLKSFHHLISATNIISSYTTSNTMANKYMDH